MRVLDAAGHPLGPKAVVDALEAHGRSAAYQPVASTLPHLERQGRVVHVGHGYRFNMSVGDVSLVNADADALTNGNRLSCLYFLNCTGAAYTYACIAEHFLRNSNGGAVSVVGANNSAFPNASTYYMNEYYRLMFAAGIVHSGQVFADSRLPRTGLASRSGKTVDPRRAHDRRRVEQ